MAGLRMTSRSMHGTDELFMADPDQGAVSVFSAGTDRLVATIPVADPQGVVYDPGKGQVFVTSDPPYPSDGFVSVISDVTDGVVEQVAVGAGPIEVAYDPNGGGVRGQLEVGQRERDQRHFGLDRRLGSGERHPAVPRVRQRDGKVFTGSEDLPNISVISDASNKVVATIDGGLSFYPAGMVYDYGRGELGSRTTAAT